MTNEKWPKTSNTEELAEFLTDTCQGCPYRCSCECSKTTCTDEIPDWLKVVMMLKYNVSLLNSDYRLFDNKDGFEDFFKAVRWSAGQGDEYFVDISTKIDNEIIKTEHYYWKNGKFYELMMDGSMKQWTVSG